jgi:hypothetical protein
MSNLKSFKTFTKERENPVVATIGRFQPPTLGHEKVFERVASLAKGNNYRIFTTQSNDSKSNPLEYEEKIKFLRKMFPKYGRNFIQDKSIKTIFDALPKLTQQGFTKLILVVGSDRIEEFNRLLHKYNGVEGKHGKYSFPDGIDVVSSGDRDPDSEGVTGMSGTKMRDAAIRNNLEDFMKGLPKGFKEARDLFNAIRVGMGLKEAFTHRQHIQLDTVSEEREDFVKGELFKVGDIVTIVESGQDGKIVELGPNFVVVETAEERKRKWITAVVKKENK